MTGAAGALAIGDVLALAGSGSAGASPTRRGEVVAIADRDVYRVRWTDGRETMLDASVAVEAARGRAPEHRPWRRDAAAAASLLS